MDAREDVTAVARSSQANALFWSWCLVDIALDNAVPNLEISLDHEVEWHRYCGAVGACVVLQEQIRQAWEALDSPLSTC